MKLTKLEKHENGHYQKALSTVRKTSQRAYPMESAKFAFAGKKVRQVECSVEDRAKDVLEARHRDRCLRKRNQQSTNLIQI